jgi:predicted dehydrogenase
MTEATAAGHRSAASADARAVGPVRCALVGVGVMGREHAEILATSPLADLVACVDVDPRAADRVPPDVPFLTSLAGVLATPGLEALFIATPQPFHEEAVRAALARGLHVFCEMPIAHTIESAVRVVALEAAHAGRLVIGHMYRFDPRWIALREAVADGRLGRLVHLSTRGFTPDFEGAALADHTSLANENSVHSLDLLQWLGGPIERVYAEASRTGVAGEGQIDSIAATLRFTSGAVGVVETDWAMPSRTGLFGELHVSIVGSEGVAWIDARDSGVGILSAQAAPAFPGTIVYRDPSGREQGIYRVEDEFFLAKVRDGRAWPVAAADARSALRVALAIDRSLEEDRPVRVEELG